jgi:hypothetical protein
MSRKLRIEYPGAAVSIVRTLHLHLHGPAHRLFFEQRHWHHFGTEIDPQSMAYIKALVASIRTTLQAGPTPERPPGKQ